MQTPTDAQIQLCEQLKHYARQHPERAAVAENILDFVLSTAECFSRRHRSGHLTGSAWLLSPEGDAALLTLHRKLGRWLQPGGHAERESDMLNVALREAEEESGIQGIQALSRDIYDIDIHPIPARPQQQEASHLHYDIRYLLQAPHRHYTCTSESQALAWWTPAEIDRRASILDEAVLRLRRQTWPTDSPAGRSKLKPDEFRA